MSDRESARQLVAGITNEHGFVDEASWQQLRQLSPELSRVFEEAMLKKDKMIGSSVITLAKNLYTSKARFVFELLQNADDNHYEEVRKLGEIPYVSFHVHSKQIVIECNEDGFNSKNLRAICNVGKSSKTGAQGYAGEKGIGFKSVFMAAYKVIIQSGNYSFSFSHRNGGSGMGMITPVWEENEDEIPDRLTRITLFLHKDRTDLEDSRSQREIILDQFKNLHEEILLFMKNIQKIDITIYDDEGEVITATSYSIDRLRATLVAAKKSTLQNGKMNEVVRYFHKTAHVVTDLAKNENREYSKDEEASKAYCRGEIILAFPLESKSGPPLIDIQSVFAFLPIRKIGFKFLIQADFVTQASRQDIVTTSARNKGLTDGIADAFIKGVLQLCENHDLDLQYQWMRYLPDTDEMSKSAFGDLWKDVIKKIEIRVKSTPILRPASLGALRRIQDLRRVSRFDGDRHGKFLFPDIQPELYIAPGYTKTPGDQALLTKLGLSCLSMQEILERVKHDLGLPNSRMKTLVDDDWHSRAARLLMLPFDKSWKERIQEMKAIELLPLRNGSWTAINSGHVYFHKEHEIEIPRDLDIDVIDPAAEAIPDRKKLFTCLGVTPATIPFVRQKIKERYRSFDQNSLTPTLSVRHFRFLYHTHHLVDDHDMYDSLRIFSEDEDLTDHTSEDLYILNDDPLGACELLAPTAKGDDADAEAPGHSVLFIHSAYLENAPNTVKGQSLSWVDWLHQFFHIRRNLRLVSRDGQALSEICSYVAKYRPRLFLGLLASAWSSEGPIIMQSNDCVGELRNTEVLCRHGRLYALGRTYLPTRELEQQCARFTNDDEYFPWLELETSQRSEIQKPELEKMARELQFGFPQTDLDFALSILRSLVHENDLLECSSLPERIYALYNYLHAKVLESTDQNACQEKIRSQFEYGDLFVPSNKQDPSGGECGWVEPEVCVWGTPIELITKRCLDRRYTEHFEQFDSSSCQLAFFFLNTLQIPLCTWENIADDIRELKDSDTADFDRLSTLYGCFNGMKFSDSDLNDVKITFQTDALICSFASEPPTWLTTSQCLWSSATRIPGKTTLNKQYPEIRSFFLDILKVPEMTWKWSSKGDGEPEVTLRDGYSDDFAIVDRIKLEKAFQKKANFLDFDLNEVRHLQHFIEWAGLEERYLSKGVKEISFADTTSTHPISTPDREIKRKAHALLRTAIAFGSPRALHNEVDFYNLLRNSETLETDKISIRLQLHQDGELLVAEDEHAMSLDIHETSEKLRVFVPRSKRDREACFHSKLPQRLFEWMMTEPKSQIRESTSIEGVKIVQSILTAYPYGLSAILEENGIAEILTPNEDEDYGSDEDDSSNEGVCEPANLEDEASDSGYSEGQNANDPSSSITQNLTPPQENESEEFPEVIATGRGASLRPTWRPTANTVIRTTSQSPLGSSRHSSTTDVDDQYLNLLDQTIRAARRAHLPSQGAFDMAGVRSALDMLSVVVDDKAVFDEPFHLRSTSQLERHRKIGAAGELFVFELLKNLDPISIPFRRENWESTIRSYVTIHPEYAAMLPWDGRETADITYNDKDGALTRLLADNGYMSRLDPEIVSQARPYYFIEVKSTTGPCKTPFFMSNSQYQRMQNCSESTSRRSQRISEVYVVFRVYNLGQDSVGLKVLFDPEDMSQRGALVFTPKTWSVVPSASDAR